MTTDAGAWDRAVASLRSARTVALTCHIAPDGDALGSVLALGLALRGLGTEVVASFDSEPFAVPRAYASLPGQDLLVRPVDFPAAPPLLITFDTGSLDRLGVLAPAAEAAGCVINVDHHASNTRFGAQLGGLDLLEPDAASSSVLALELADRLGVELTADIAACVYTGLTTDTGSFKFAAVTPATHELAARLLSTGMRHDLISRAVWDTNRFGYLKLLGRLLDRTSLEPAHELVWTWCTADDLGQQGVGLDEIEGVIDVLRTAEEAEVAVICKGRADGAWLVSTRSKGRVDVGAICVRLGGGGHRFAAGFTSTESLDAVVAALRTEIDAAPRLPA
jgi:phosphoesterase RecJ-like protein